MYVEFFGLKQTPFRARASGGDVFVGPQQARLMSGLKKALIERDAVVSISGPVGVGKTISSARALDAVTSNKTVARIGRMQLGREEILELLLIEFDLAGKAHTTPQRFGAFRGLLNDREDENVRVFIVVEDACRIGIDGLAELESLTSADSGDSSGANIILLGPPEFEQFIKTPELARLRQRIRLRHTLNPLTPAEVRGYVAHRIREAGGDVDTIFDAEAINTLHRCSEGIPRMVNSLANAVLGAAAEARTAKVSAELVARIAAEDFGVESVGTEAPAPGPEKATGAAAEDAAGMPGLPNTADSHSPPDALKLPDDIEIPELIQDTMPEIKALPDPALGKTPQEVIAALRDKTNSTEPSLPVLDMSLNRPASENELLNGLGAEALVAEERRVMLEPRAPEPLSKTLDPADTQTIKALDSALRPDTQLLEALEMVAPVLPDNTAVPIGLQDGSQPANSTATGTEKLPTLSDSMRLDAPPAATQPDAATPQSTKTPDINALEAALAVARKGPIALQASEPARPVANTPPPAMPAAPTTTPASAAPASPPLTASTPPAPAAPAIPPRAAESAAPQQPASDVPEITLDNDMQRQQEAARARLAAEAAKIEAANAAKKEKPQSEAERAAAAERAAEKKRLSGMSSIAAQFSAGTELTLEDTQSTRKKATPEQTREDDKETAAKGEDAAEQVRMQKLAAELGSARSLEDIDDLAAETLFGEEFSQIAATIAAMAANDTEAAEALEPAQPASEPAAVASAAPNAAPPRSAAPAPSAPAAGAPAAQAQPQTALAPPAARPPAQRPPAQRPPSPADIDSSAARRLEMVRSLNKGARPVANATVTEDIVLGESDSSPTHSGPAPEPIENQFGTSMTANLKALSTQSIDAMQKAEKQEEKKRGLLSRFKRS